MRTIIKRNGEVIPYDRSKIANAVRKAMNTVNDNGDCEHIALLVEQQLDFTSVVTVEQTQDIVEKTLIEHGYYDVGRAYISYRDKQARKREINESLVDKYHDIVFSDAKDSDIKRENANVDGNTPMGTMLKIGSESAKAYALEYMMSKRFADAHKSGQIHIHDLDFMPTGTTTCCQIDIEKLFQGGFSTGHGHLREPQDIAVYGALAAIAIQSNQNDQHGGQSIPNFDYGMAEGVKKTFYRELIEVLTLLIAMDTGSFDKEAVARILPKAAVAGIEDINKNTLLDKFDISVYTAELVIKRALQATERKAYQAMEAFLHNLNTMHSRAGAQVPFSSINYGTDTSPEGRMVIKQLLLATEAGLGNGETAIFPIQVFKVKEGVNFNQGDPNYDLLQLSFRVSAKRLFPNYVFLDAPFNLQYYKEGNPETEVATMGCRTRVIGSVFSESDGISYGRGNLSFTTINLPRIGFEVYEQWNKGNIRKDQLITAFKEILNNRLNLVADQLVERFAFQSRKTAKNFPSLIGEGIWFQSDRLGKSEPIGEILKHGTLSIGFIGLAEALILLTGSHHGESAFAQSVGVNIIRHMRDFCDRKSKELQLNITLLATPAEGLSGRFTMIDREIYGAIAGVTDKDYYTNSFHVPVYYKITIFEKIRTEAPYHALCNAGHISYVELDGAAKNNLEAFEIIIRNMAKLGIGYGSINHPIDRDLICGYTGIIEDHCLGCGRDTRDGKDVERIRRITGYLVGSLDHWNDAKKAEEKQRVKHY